MSIDLLKKDLIAIISAGLEHKMIERIESKFLGSNVFVVSHGNDCIIVDAGVSLDELKKFVTGKKVLAILLTHGHYDHCFYVGDYIKEFDCKVFCSKEIVQYLKNADYNYSDGTFKFDNFSHFVFLKESGEIDAGTIKIKYQQLGGHSKSDMVYFVDDDVFVGDLLIGRDMGRIDLFGGNKEDMKRSLNFLLNQNYQIMHSGHGQDNTKMAQDKVINLWLKFLNR